MKKNNSKGNIYIYLQWPIIITMLLIILTFIVYNISVEAGFFVFVFTLIVLCFSVFMLLNDFNNVKMSVFNLANSQSSVLRDFLKNTSMPMCIVVASGNVVWANDSFLNIDDNVRVGMKIQELFVDIEAELLNSMNTQKLSILSSYKDKQYNIHMGNFPLNFNNNDNTDASDKYIYLFFEDETEYYTIRQNYEDEKNVIGLIYLDNYDEVTENIEDSKVSMLIAIMDRKITRYISTCTGVIKKLEKDKYFFVTNKKQLSEMMKDKFAILDEIKDIIGGDNIPFTLSIGIGFNEKSIEANYDLATQAIDLALGRGGDQVVIKDGKNNYFFGGKSASVESTERVRARVKATSFREILETKDKVLIMGHTNEDLDSFGSSIGVYVMATFLGKKAYIINNTITRTVAELKQKFIDSDQYSKDMFITGDKAMEEIGSDTLVVILDHNTPNISDDKRILDSGAPIVMIDHHRMQETTIKDAVMSYVEPSASSASELITEIIKFFDDKMKIKPLEAEALLSGIMMDTLNFTYHASVKTFDCASFLKKNGADINRVRKLLRINKVGEKLKNEIIENTEYYKDCYAIAILPEGIEDVSILASQIANELINITDIKASVVIYPYGKGYYLSSRSIDELNVQVLMEKLGGGGHRSQAGAKIEADNVEEVVEKLKTAIDEVIGDKEDI